MPRLPIAIALLFALPLSVSLACSSSPPRSTESKRHVEVSADALLPYAVGESASLHLWDYRVGPTECHAPTSELGHSPSGCGGSGTNPREECSEPVHPNNSTVESVTCEGACTATAKVASAGRFDVTVVGRDPGPARVVVRLRDPTGDVHEATATVTFVRATHITVVRIVGSSPHGTAYAALPGARFSWCTQIDADGTLLAYDPARLHVAVTGTTSRTTAAGGPPNTTRCDVFEATTPGTIDFTASFGELTRHETIRVVDPSDVKSIELRELDIAGNWSGGTPIESDALAGAPVLTRLALDACRRGAPGIAQRLGLSDGSSALAPVSALMAEPADLVGIGANDGSMEHDVLGWLAPRSRGEGMLTSTVGTAHASIPISITGACLDPTTPEAGDGGEADAADAGSD